MDFTEKKKKLNVLWICWLENEQYRPLQRIYSEDKVAKKIIWNKSIN